MPKYCIAIIGKTAAGKGTFGIMLQEELGKDVDVAFHRFSDSLNEALDALGLERARANQQWLSTEVRKKHGEEIIGKTVSKRIEADMADIAFLDGVRRPQDIITIRKLPHNTLVVITAPAKKRFERLKKRADRPGDAEKTWEEFCAEQNAEPEIMIDKITKNADYHIDNFGSLEDLRNSVKVFIIKCLKELAC